MKRRVTTSRFSKPATLLAVFSPLVGVPCRSVVVASVRLKTGRPAEAWIGDLHFYSTFKCKEIDGPCRRLEDQLLGNRFVQPVRTKALLQPEYARARIESSIGVLRVAFAPESETHLYLFPKANLLYTIQPILPVTAH